RPAREYPWKSAAFAGWHEAGWPVPLPRTYALGLDWSYVVQEHPEIARGPNYVLGQLNYDGRWYAFPLMLLLKTPLALFALLLWSALLRRGPGNKSDLAVLLLPSLAMVAAFSLLVNAQIGVRYLLPAVPP